MRLATYLLGGTSGLLRLLARTTHLTLRCWDFVWLQWLIVSCSHCTIMGLRWRPAMRLATDLLVGTSDLPQLLALAKHIQFMCWDLMCVYLLTVNCLLLHTYALDMASYHASGEGPVGESVGFTQTSGPDQTHSIQVLGVGVYTMVDC